MARRSMSERNATLSKLERVPRDPPPAEESVLQIVSAATACENPRHRNEVVSTQSLHSRNVIWGTSTLQLRTGSWQVQNL